MLLFFLQVTLHQLLSYGYGNEPLELLNYIHMDMKWKILKKFRTKMTRLPGSRLAWSLTIVVFLTVWHGESSLCSFKEKNFRINLCHHLLKRLASMVKSGCHVDLRHQLSIMKILVKRCHSSIITGQEKKGLKLN